MSMRKLFTQCFDQNREGRTYHEKFLMKKQDKMSEAEIDRPII